MKATDPAGTSWRVGRRWLPWRRRLHVPFSEDRGPMTYGDDPISSLISTLSLLLFIPQLIMMVLVAFEIVLQVLLVPVAAVFRTVFRRPWTVQVRRRLRVRWDAAAGSWRESGQRIGEIATAIERGDLPPGCAPVPGAAEDLLTRLGRSPSSRRS